jgi:hypothetical protein
LARPHKSLAHQSKNLDQPSRRRTASLAGFFDLSQTFDGPLR